ncbi:MAG: streptomycin 6-kinase [Frankiaceae bacterium]|nr:streptomycin 6-kinase [Frankiaceae bacterium]
MRVPDDLARTVAAWAGPAGAAWLAALPDLVTVLAQRWSLAVGAAYQPSGYTSLALRAVRADGTPCVLKLRCPAPDPAPEAAGLRAFGGRAAVALLAEDVDRGALLLERCEPGTPLLGRVGDDEATRVICGLLPDLWLPGGDDFVSTAEVANRWAATLSGAVTVAARLRDEALDLLAGLAAYGGQPVVLHGDLHAANVLRATRRPWLAIDPKPLAGDPAFDVAAVLRDRASPANVAQRLAIAADVVDRARARGWALAQAVEGAVWSYDVGDARSGDAFVLAAEALAATAH